MLTQRFTAALEYGRAHHADDVRTGTTIPYVSHLLAVCALVLEHGGTEPQTIAALLHDVVEDGGGEAALADIDDRFGSDVAAIVAGCSDTTSLIKRAGSCARTASHSFVSGWPDVPDPQAPMGAGV